MKLADLTRDLPVEKTFPGNPEITGLTCDTRTLRPGNLFAALPGTRADGNDYIQTALDRGAAAVLCRTPPDAPGPWLVTPAPRRTFALLCRTWFGDPAA